MAKTPTTNIPLGFEAPSFTLLDVSSEAMVNSEEMFANGPTVVVFMCNHCPFVVHILEAFVAFAAECRDRGVNVVAISSNDVVNYPQDDVHLMKDLAETHGFTFPYLYDPTQEMPRAD